MLQLYCNIYECYFKNTEFTYKYKIFVGKYTKGDFMLKDKVYIRVDI